MAGEIKHSWNGTVLTITSDSGTSSMDLKGGAGDLGPRGPQGPAGVLYGEDGAVLADNLVTTDYVDTILANMTDLSDYATKEYVAEKVVEAATGGGITLDGYATEDYVNSATANILAEVETNIETSVRAAVSDIGNPVIQITAFGSNLTDMDYIPVLRPFQVGTIYHFKLTFSNGAVEEFYTKDSTNLPPLEMEGSRLYSFDYPGTRVGSFLYRQNADGRFIAAIAKNSNIYVKDMVIDVTLDPITISPAGIPIDNQTLKFNTDNKLYADTTNLATKQYVAEQIVSVNTNGTINLGDLYAEKSALTMYYTKTEINALIDSLIESLPVFNNAEEMKF